MACNSQATAVFTAAIPQKSATLTATEIPTQFPIITQTNHPKPVFIPSRTQSPIPTPTFDVRTIVTRTPAPRAQCPVVQQPNKVPDFEYPLGTSETVKQFHDHVLDFLNAGGSPQAIIKLYQQHISTRIDNKAQIIDLTGDNNPELLLVAGDYSVAYLCKDGQYEIKGLMVFTYNFDTPTISRIKDINRDGIPEIIFLAGDLRFRSYTVDEWDGSGFQALNHSETRLGFVAEPCATLMGESALETVDTGKTLELILKQGISIWSEYSQGLPWRKETRTCTWNGSSFILTHIQLAPPQYRILQPGWRPGHPGWRIR